MIHRISIALLFVSSFCAFGQDQQTVISALEKSVSFYRSQVGFNGAYVYRVSSDLGYKEGEKEATKTTGWIEPPGTPFVGNAYLRAYQLTGEAFLLDAALEVANALKQTQLESGGWADRIEMGNGKERYRYRSGSATKNAKNVSTLDDNKTQSCLKFLIGLDQQTEHKLSWLHEMTLYSLNRLVSVQYPNGAWRQKFESKQDHNDLEILKANYPERWPRTFPNEKYQSYYTLNDGTVSDMLSVMLDAFRVYQDKRYRDSAIKTGEFLILAQMPDPQPGWAQQYNHSMQPVWARKFEPPAVTGGESQKTIRSLMEIYRATGDRKFLEPIPRALEYFKDSLRPDGQLARFYELQTNRPIYFNQDYQFTYKDNDLPTHYGFIVKSKLESIEAEYLKLRESIPKPRKQSNIRMTNDLKKRVLQALEAMDSRGAWVENGTMKHFDGVTEMIDSKTFVRRMTDLVGFISAAKGEKL